MSKYYTNMAAFKRAFLTRDIYAEQAEKIRLHNETKDRIDAEIAQREDWGLGGKIIGGVTGWFLGGPSGAKAGMKAGEALFSNIDNTDYSEFLPSKNDYLGKFSMAKDLEDYKNMVNYADDLEYMHEVNTGLDALGAAKDVFMTDWSDALDLEGDTEWWDKTFKEKIKFTRESLQDNKMRDFMRNLNKINEIEALTPAEKALKTALFDELDMNVEDMLFSVKDEFLASGDYSLDSINAALDSLGIAGISQDVLDNIINYDQLAFDTNLSIGRSTPVIPPFWGKE
jgi:hypothetical protein